MYKTRSPTCFAILLHPKSASKCSPCRVASDESALGISHCSTLTTLYYSVESSGPPRGNNYEHPLVGCRGTLVKRKIGFQLNYDSVVIHARRWRKRLIAGGDLKCKRILSRSMKHAVRYSDTNTTSPSSLAPRGIEAGIMEFLVI